jgi:hypothetical protein
MYDANLARWMSPDPYGEFHSPYLAMGNNPVSTIDPDGGKTVAMAPEPPPEPQYDGRQDDWLIEKRDAIAMGGSYGNRENRFYFEDGVPVNNGHSGSETFADYEANYELFEVTRIRQSREAHNKNRIRTSTLKNVFTKIIIRASNLFTKIDYVFADAQSNGGNLINPSSDEFYTQLQRNASIEALVLLGFDRKQVSKDVKAASRYNATISNKSFYTSKMQGGYFDSHSISFNAFQSGALANSLYAVKIYENGNISIVYSNLIDHIFEASAEVMEMGLGKIGMHHYMHERNAIGFMNFINKLPK